VTLYSELSQSFDGIVSVHVSSDMTGTVRTARLAAEQIFCLAANCRSIFRGDVPEDALWLVWFSMWTISLLFAMLAAYAWGSISPTYLAARWRKGIDLRRYGSGTVGGMNLGVQLGLPWAVAIGALDWTKGLAPAALARAWGWEWGSAVLLSLATVLGHNWSLYLDFKGGRGIAVTIGALFAWDWRLALAFLVIIAIGWRIKQGAPSCMVALLLLAPAAAMIGCPREIIGGSLGLLLIAIIKRVEANRLPLPPAAREKRIVLLRRLWFDRDIPSDRLWQERGETVEAR